MSTEKSGIINSDQTWSGNILVTGSVKVTNGATLTISAGTQITVQSGGDYKIWIDSTGFLVANTNNDDISISSDGSGTDDWKGIEFTDNTMVVYVKKNLTLLMKVTTLPRSITRKELMDKVVQI